MSGYQLEYTPETKVTLEAMKLAGGVVFSGASALLLWVQVLVLGLLVPAGFLAVVLAVKIAVTGSGSFSQPIWLPAIFVLSGAAGMWLNNRVHWQMAQAAGASRFGKRVRISISPEAFVFAGGNSEWRMDWGDIDGVVKGRRVLVVCTGAVALPVPISAFESPVVAQTAFEKMTQWHQEAIS